MLNKYLLRFSVQQIQEHDFGKAVSTINKYGVPNRPENLDVYLRLSREVLREGKAESVTELRELLFKLVGNSISWVTC